MIKLTIALVIVASMSGCTSGSGGAQPQPAAASPDAASRSAAAPDEWFSEQASPSGLDFVHFNGASGKFYYPETLPPGVALFDYDNDGDLDVYVVQGKMLDPSTSLANALMPPGARSLPLKGRLYRNDLQIHDDGSRTLHFTDVTAQSGIDARQYGLGVATGDFNNDGCVDLFLTNFGTNQLYRNNCDGTFTDVTKESGLEAQPGIAVSASFLDYDRDGLLDLYIGYNAVYTIANGTVCPNVAGVRDYCPPRTYSRQPDRLYHNVGNGKFIDVTAKALPSGRFGPALGVSTADFNGDGWIDIFVANDGTDNLLLINQRDGTFKEAGLLAGVAVSDLGKPEASMGVDAGDFDNDGDEDLVFANLTGEGTELLVNDGTGTFQNAKARSGLGTATLPDTGFATAWIDFDNDGWLDILTVNGRVALEGKPNGPFPYDQRKQLFRNMRNGTFQDVTDKAGAAFKLSDVGRGAAFGDIDNDGDMDVVVGNDAGPLRLFINNVGNRNHWIGARLAGPTAARPAGPAARAPHVRDMLGAQLAVIRQDGPTLFRRARSDGSYASANDPRVLVGLGTSAERPRLRVRWPSGRVEEWSDVAIDQWTTLEEGGGKPASWPVKPR